MRPLALLLLALQLLSFSGRTRSQVSRFAGGAVGSLPALASTLPPSATAISAVAGDATSLYVAAGECIRRAALDAAGSVTSVAVLAGDCYVVNASITTQAEGLEANLTSATRVVPSALAANASGLYFADQRLSLLRFITLGAVPRIFTAAGNGSLAGGYYTGFPVAPAPARSVPLGLVAALAQAPDAACCWQSLRCA